MQGIPLFFLFHTLSDVTLASLPLLKYFFLYQRFLSRALAIHRTAGKERAPSFIPLFHSTTLPLFYANIQTFVLQLCTSDDPLISNRTACIYQATTRWDLPPYRITIWLIDDVMLIFVCLFVDLIQGFCYSYLILETDGLELASTIILVLQANRLNKCASHPKVSSKEHWKVCTNAATNFWGQKNKAG